MNDEKKYHIIKNTKFIVNLYLEGKKIRIVHTEKYHSTRKKNNYSFYFILLK